MKQSVILLRQALFFFSLVQRFCDLWFLFILYISVISQDLVLYILLMNSGCEEHQHSTFGCIVIHCKYIYAGLVSVNVSFYYAASHFQFKEGPETYQHLIGS